jgi:Flp pilus assembly protein TadD
LLAVEAHPEEAMIQFNLACYVPQIRKLDEARNRLEEAIRLAPEVRTLALEHPDLEPIW